MTDSVALLCYLIFYEINFKGPLHGYRKVNLWIDAQYSKTSAWIIAFHKSNLESPLGGMFQYFGLSKTSLNFYF